MAQAYLLLCSDPAKESPTEVPSDSARPALLSEQGQCPWVAVPVGGQVQRRKPMPPMVQMPMSQMPMAGTVAAPLLQRDPQAAKSVMTKSVVTKCGVMKFGAIESGV